MNVLVLGSGGREHSICSNIIKSKILKNLWCIPGNAGIQKISKVFDLDLKNHQEVINFCIKKKIDIVIPGSEVYLENGISDSLRLEGIKVFGPSKKASLLESSKIFTKKICNISKINTAKWKSFDSIKSLENSLKYLKFPLVIKLDSLAAGKGVLVAKNLLEAEKFLANVKYGLIGDKNTKIIIEEKLIGEEASFFFITDGKSVSFLGSAKDYKTVGENNTGLNTGGMGCISPSPYENKKNINIVLKDFIKPTIKTMNSLGYTYKGILYAGLMFTKKGIYLIEYNIRLGDPECQSIFSRLKSDFLNICLRAEKEKLNNLKVKLDKKKSLCVVLASKGYPGKYKTGFKINGIKDLEKKPVDIYHAGTKYDKNKNFLTSGGRVLNLVVKSNKIDDARLKMFDLIKKISCSNLFYRKDIGN